MRNAIAAISIMLWEAVMGTAHASSALDMGSITATVTATTDYLFRGVSQNARVPALQGDIELTDAQNWYGGLFASKVNPEDHENTALELVLYGGIRFDWRGTALDVSVNYYAYPDHHPRPGSPRYSSVELIASANRTWGNLTAGGTVAWSPNYFDDGSASYAAGNASYQINPWLAASATLGEQGVLGRSGIGNSGYAYTHWDAGLTATIGAFSLDARYAATSLGDRACLATQGGRDWCSGALIVSVSYRVSLAASERATP